MKNLIISFFLIFICKLAYAQPNINLSTHATSFNAPVDIVNAGDGTDRLFIVEQAGIIEILDANGTQFPTPFLNISSDVSTGGERGLLGMVFHPNYATNGFFFVNYTNNSGDTRISRFSVSTSSPHKADPASEKILMTISQPFSNHNAGDLAFGPDGYLYIGTGDGGSGGDPQCYAQTNDELLGKMLRVDVDQNVNTAPYYGIPPSNPFIGNTDYVDEIWATGLRNPWRYSFDRVTGDLWIADVGQNNWEEVNKQDASSTGGEDYGWKVMEGNNCFDFDPIDTDCPSGTPSCFDASYTGPVFEYAHNVTNGGESITGGFVYRGCAFPELEGYYIFADFSSDNVWAIDGNGNNYIFNNLGSSISTFGEDEDGEMYAASYGGTIYRVTETTTQLDCSCPVNAINDGNLSGTYSAQNTILSTGTVAAGQSVVFNANCIELTSDFEVELNAEFCAEINPCAPFSNTNTSTTEKK